MSEQQNAVSTVSLQNHYRRHAQGAYVRSGASLLMWTFAFAAFLLGIIRVEHITGISLAVAYLVLINPPLLWLMRRIRRSSTFRYTSLAMHLLEIIGYTAVIYFLGGIEATYLVLIYGALITYVGVTARRSFTFTVAAMCCAVFGLMVAATHFGVLPEIRVKMFALPWPNQIAIVLVVSGLLFVLAYIASFTGLLLHRSRWQLQRTNEELREKAAALQEAETRLREAYQASEATVRERTGELQRVNERLAREIAERKAAAEQLQKSEAKYRLIAEKMSDVVWTSDLELRLTYVSPSAERLYGFPAALRLGMSLGEVLTPGSLQKVRETWAAEWGKEQTNGADPHRSVALELEYYRRDGSTVWVETVVTAIRDEQGAPVGLIGVDRDITERRRDQEIIREREEALRESEGFLQSLFRCLPDAIVVMDWGGNILFANETAAKTAGCASPGELVGRNMTEFLHPDSLEKAFVDLENVRAGIENYVSEHRVFTAGGEPLWMESNGTRISYRGGDAILVALRDATARKRAEEDRERLRQELARVQRLESIGTLAGGIAHDFNNLLMGIQGHASLIGLDLDTAHPHWEHVRGIEDLVRSGADLTGKLLSFARGGRYEVKPVNINTLIEKTVALFGRTRKDITIHQDLAADLWNVEVDRSQLEQVFLNLFVNAGEAMPAGGDLFVRTENISVEEERLPSIAPGHYVQITVRDTGVGMDTATRERIFEPFFTTRAMGRRGVGLGLATVYGVIKGHGGFIGVDSAPGRGTTFTIYLPRTDRKAPEEPTAERGTALPGEGVILLVDDEAMVREVGKSMLERMGYRVLCAGSGQEALAVYQEKGGDISLVMLDMIMPGISGAETFDRLRKINPRVKVLLCSGYSIDGQAREILERGCNGFLQKPFTFEKLGREITAILQGTGP